MELQDLCDRQSEAIDDCITEINLLKAEIKRKSDLKLLYKQQRNWTVILCCAVVTLIILL